ncbi:sensor histidine kinase [Anaerocolumna aminovalerica]|uniref:sensor histidine kinase n=1 Tax=Anaerocolumna aminovalerica TaxID=1527 RepID=UPI001C0F085B|nr:histidine kinase [Anaerocolumna aminovalerica]MBU5332031.1 sensor histidine kinase [Anaerocolumna aminovalerica]
MKSFLNKLSIKKKIILYSYLVVTPTMLLISGFLFIKNYKENSRNQIQSNLKTVSSLASSIDMIQAEVMDLSTYICINTKINSILTSSNPGELNKDVRLWLNDAPMQMIQDMVALKGYIKTVAIYPENGVRPYLRCIDSSSYLQNIEQVREQAIYQKTLENKGKVVWQRSNKDSKDTYQANRNDKIVLHRELFDLAKKKKLGYIVIGISADKITHLCENAVQNISQGILVLSSDGTELIRFGKVDDTVAKFLQNDSYITENYKRRTDNFTYKDYHIFAKQNDKNNAIIFKIVAIKDLKSQMLSIAYTPIILLIGFWIGLFPVLIFISNIVSKPLGTICKAMEKFKQGDFNQQVEVVTRDEVGMVAACFNQMVKDIKELINANYVIELRERESELTALQAQINPHFLYNTLDTLYWQAENAGNEEIAENILALSQLFRLVLGEGKGIITVREEKELIYRYLQIQKMRFSKRFDFVIQMDEFILEQNIPKLILQPFVENAIVHGFENTDELGFLSINGYREGNYLLFHIKDNGKGMNSEQVAAICEMEDSMRYASQRIGRYAIRNVKERLELKYKDDFNLEIFSEMSQGTEVVIKVPMSIT